jgi:plastocyanin domain-containing protein
VVPDGKEVIMRYFCLAVMFVFVAGVSHAQEEVKAEMGEDGVQRIELVSGSYYFKPEVIILKVNVPVEMKVRKEGDLAPHNLVIRAPEAGMDIRVKLEQKEKIIRFTPTSVGMYSFYCDRKLLLFKSHRDRGMEGMIEVVE